MLVFQRVLCNDASMPLHACSDRLLCTAQPASALVFPKQRSGERALQAVQVVSARRRGAAVPGSSDSSWRPYTFTFCMERVQSGPYKVCSSPSAGPSWLYCMSFTDIFWV